MPTYVVDASVVIEYLVTGDYTSNATALFQQMTDEERLIVPEFCLVECTNVLWKHVRFQGMPVVQAETLLQDLRKLPLERVSVKALLPAALRIGLLHQLAIYDSVYIALASHANIPLITIDERQSYAVNAEGIRLKPIKDFTL
jgi:predicted nucleic acid-binding protein